MSDPYVDTSALAKWYLNEARSTEVETYLQQHATAAISRLTAVEFRCLLARRRRAGEIDAAVESAVFKAFEDDIRRGALTCHALDDQHAIDALALIQRLRTHALRTLDALHLAISLRIAASEIATADRGMAAAAQAMGMNVARFD